MDRERPPNPTNSLEVQKFLDLLQVLNECCPSRNVRSICHVMLSYAVAETVDTEDKTVFSDTCQRVIQTSLDHYIKEREENVLKDQADMEKREEEIEHLERRYHMGTKLDEFDIRQAHRDANTIFGVSNPTYSPVLTD